MSKLIAPHITEEVRAADQVPSTKNKLKKAIRHGFSKTHRRHIASPLDTTSPWNHQADCRLLALPFEIREQIWQYVLAGPEDSEPESHLHIYADVYDCCTYYPPTSKNHILKRQGALQTALLRTCRVIHSESIQLLYDITPFTLVLLSGLARPSHRISKRNRLGSMESCTPIWNRIRHAWLVIQPGRQPLLQPYLDRIAAFIKVINHIPDLRIWTNFSVYLDWMTHGLPVLQALIPLASSPCKRKRQLYLASTTRITQHPNFTCLRPVDLSGFELQFMLQTTEGGGCLVRGAFGEPWREATLLWTPWQHVVADILAGTVVATGLLLLPLGVGTVVWFHYKRQRDKGQIQGLWSRARQIMDRV